jgi:ketosteroid isomerase-like protein
MSTTSTDFDEFMKQRKAASDAFVNGDIKPLDQISAHASPATIFGPKGNCVQGAEQVNTTNAAGAKNFKPGGKNEFEVMHKAASDEFAYWVGVQRSAVQMEGQEHAVPFSLRVTEIFRRENGEWKLFHRHADPLKPGDCA